MSRREEIALVRAVLAIGAKIAAMQPDPLYTKPEDVRGLAMFYSIEDHHELGAALVPLRQILDADEARTRRGRR